MGTDAGPRLLVVGASSGIGRATARAAWDAGWRVAVAARRAEPLAEVVQDRPAGSALALVGDAAADGVAASFAAQADEVWGGLDAVLYCAAVTHLAPLEAMSSADWSRLFASNTVGAAHVAAATLPLLHRSGGRFAALSSDSVDAPLEGLLAYSVTKAALNHLLATLGVEFPGVPVTRIVIGPTTTDLAAAWDPALMGAYFERWIATGWFDEVTPQPVEVPAAAIVRRWLEAPATDLAPVLDLSVLSRPGAATESARE